MNNSLYSQFLCTPPCCNTYPFAPSLRPIFPITGLSLFLLDNVHYISPFQAVSLFSYINPQAFPIAEDWALIFERIYDSPERGDMSNRTVIVFYINKVLNNFLSFLAVESIIISYYLTRIKEIWGSI